MTTILSNIKAFIAAELLRGRKVPERSGAAIAGSFPGEESFFRLMAGWFSVLLGNRMDLDAYRLICSHGSEIRIITEDSLQSEIKSPVLI